MTNPIAPFGLQVLDPNWLAAGATAPSLRCVPASDQNAFAVGDVVHETGAFIGGVAAVSSTLLQLKSDGTAYPYFFPSAGATPLIVVAVAPAVPSLNGVSPVLPAGAKGATGMVWVIPAGSREFFIAGDASTPARAELPASGDRPYSLFAQNLDGGAMFARLRYGSPLGGVSGTTLDGSSFTDGSVAVPAAPGGHGVLQVLGLASGMPLAPRSMYRVRFRSFS
jgi:hypothetical protein